MRRLEFLAFQVKDLEASKKFYTEKLGFQLSDMKNPDAVIFKFKEGDASFAIRKPLENLDNKELGNGVSAWFSISEDIEDLKENLQNKGVAILGSIMNTPFGRALHVKDLDGYKLTLLEKN